MNSAPPPAPPPDPPRALLSAAVAFGMWGVLPMYWKACTPIGATMIVAHRVWGTLLFMLPLLLWRKELKFWWASVWNAQLIRIHGLAATLLTVNWGLYIWASQNGHIVEASLGYFLNPLLNVLIGRLFLGERLSSMRKISVALASAGVLLQVLLVGRLPWVALALGLTFALYGLVRRKSPMTSLPGTAMESLLVLPFALLWLLWQAQQGVPLMGPGRPQDILLVLGAGVLTALPLLTFAYAARELRFSTLGLMQFIAPTGQFLIGALVYQEPVTSGVLASFALIWTGIAVFCVDTMRRR